MASTNGPKDLAAAKTEKEKRVEEIKLEDNVANVVKEYKSLSRRLTVQLI